MRKKNMWIAAALMMTAASIVSCDNAPQGETIVIEGEFTNVPDSLPITLLEDIGMMLPIMGVDTLLDGKFYFEGISDNGGVNPTYIYNSKNGIVTHHSLWTMPGARIRITGDGMDYSTWTIESNVPAQKTENKFRANAHKELSELTKAYMDYYRTRDEKYYQIAEALIQETIPYKDIPLLETLPVDESWMNHMYHLSNSKDTVLLAKGKELSKRMSEEQRTSYRGIRVMNNLFPPKKIGIGDMIPEITLKDTLGYTHRLQELQGKFLLLDFWSAGCSPCIMSIPELKELSEELKESLEVVSISRDTEKQWKQASAKHNFTWHNWNDLKQDIGIFTLFGIQGIPHYFMVSPEGKVLGSTGGYSKGSLKPFVQLTMERNGQKAVYRTEGEKRINDYPTVSEEHIDCMYIRRVELTDKGTDITFKVFYPHTRWFLISSESHLITDGNNKLPILKATGITLDKKTHTPESGTMEFTLHFPTLPEDCASFSYYEEENKSNDCWRMIGVKVKK